MARESETPIAAALRAAQAGDQTAFGQLVESYQRAVFAQCLRLSANRADAEDLAHDTFVQAFTQIRQLRDPTHFGGWLKTIALNLYRSALRQQYKTTLSLAGDPAIPIAAAANERWEELEKNLWRLSPAQRLVLALHYWEGLSYEEIARFIDVPLGTVMSRLHRARQNLKDGESKDDAHNGAIDMNCIPDLSKEIDAEIKALGRLFVADPESMERLSALLRHSPARFAQLIEEMAADELDPLAALLRRLGAPAMAVALDCYFSADDPIRQRALSLMQALTAQDLDWHSDKNWSDGTTLAHITQTTYALLDQVIARSVPETEKVELLLALAKAPARPGLISELCWKVMLSYPETAFSLLRAKLESIDEVSSEMPPAELAVFVRFGTASCHQLLSWLDDERVQRQKLGLAGMVALAARLNPRGPGGVLSTQERGNPLFRDHWLLLSKDLDPSALAALSERAAALATGDEAQTRETALSLLGAIRQAEPATIEALCHCLDHTERPTRLAALNALGEIGLGDQQNPTLAAVEKRILFLVGADNYAEQVAALTALGRLRVESARPLLTRQAETATNAEVREAAINGLGQIGGEESALLLRRLQVSEAKDLRKKASRWLQRLQENEEKKETLSPAQRARQKRLAHFRGEQSQDVSFPYHRFHINLGAAIRSLPELRSYPEMELTRYFAQVCVDYSFARRVLADRGLLHREEGLCTLTEAGERVWRVEHFIGVCYLGDKPI